MKRLISDYLMRPGDSLCGHGEHRGISIVNGMAGLDMVVTVDVQEKPARKVKVWKWAYKIDGDVVIHITEGLYSTANQLCDTWHNNGVTFSDRFILGPIHDTETEL